ncbi:hypothetical protein [Aquimarina aggregata]|uniref:hypothetical protein n=1 Tax=Aquimarina aggregata TaxID=1642818 RepID=UPI002492136E|nr:hypothetical protein [Aquimarina aggregata]
MIKIKRLFGFIAFLALGSCSVEELNQNDLSTNDASQIVKQLSNSIIPVGDVTDLANYSSKPYRSKGAGYIRKDFINLPDNRKLTFKHRNGKDDSDELNKMITNLSQVGGGQITIKKGKYFFQQVTLKSNIHITIEAGTIMELADKSRRKRFLFAIGTEQDMPLVENVRIVGLGTPSNRPKFILKKKERLFIRAFNTGYAKNVLIENFTIKDELTGGTAIAFNPTLVNNVARRPENVTVANVRMSRASQGYGLIQTNVGKNMLFKNLACVGGMTCRIESHTGRKYDLGVSNIIINNVVSIKGKAAVLLQPHSVENGRVIVDVARSEGSAWTLFLRKGFVSPESLRREPGTFSPASKFSNISMISNDYSARLSFKNLKDLPTALRTKYEKPNFRFVTNDHNYILDDSGNPDRESAIRGPSVAVICTDAPYLMNLPSEHNISLEGKLEDRLKIIDKTK